MALCFVLEDSYLHNWINSPNLYHQTLMALLSKTWYVPQKDCKGLTQGVFVTLFLDPPNIDHETLMALLSTALTFTLKTFNNLMKLIVPNDVYKSVCMESPYSSTAWNNININQQVDLLWLTWINSTNCWWKVKSHNCHPIHGLPQTWREANLYVRF